MEENKNSKAVISLVLALISLVALLFFPASLLVFGICVSGLFALGAIIFGFMGIPDDEIIKTIKKCLKTGKPYVLKTKDGEYL